MACIFTVAAAQAFAQTPPSTPAFPPYAGSGALSANSTVLDLGSHFLRRLANEASARSAGAPSTNNPFGGGADMQSGAEQPVSLDRRWRVWFEGYGLHSRMDADATFAGDKRETWGGVAGIGLVATPGVAFGLSVDQSRSKIDLSRAVQYGTIDLTQVGANLAIESGAWTFAAVGVYGAGQNDLQRGGGPTPALANYDVRIWGVLAELSYLWTSGNWRVVPKVGFDWSGSHSDAFSEFGGTGNLINGSAQNADRARVMGGFEVGHSWFSGQTIVDLAGYVRAVEIVALDRGGLTIESQAGAFNPRTIPGVSEDRTGLDTGASFSWRFSPAMRVYAMYDGRFRSNFEAHTGTLGLELKW